MKKLSKESNLKTFLEVKNQTNDVAELCFYGDIVSDEWQAWTDEDKYPSEVKEFIDQIGNKDLNIYINSGGGSVYAGFAIYNILKRHNGKKVVYIDGIAASIASVIAFAGDEIVMPKNSYLMIHQPMMGVWGNAMELREQADYLDRLCQSIVTTYKDHLVSEELESEIDEFVKGDKYFEAEEAKQYFNKITLVEPNEAVAYIDSENLENAPFAKSKKVTKKQLEENKSKKLLEEINTELIELDFYLELDGGIIK